MTDHEQDEGAVATAAQDHDHDEFTFVEDPTFAIDYKGECQYEVKVSVALANEAKQTEEMLSELKADAELPGFRKGRAPVRLIEKKFSKSLKSEVTAKLVGAAFQKLLKDEDLKPAGYPDIDGLDGDEPREDGAPLEFTLKFDVAPRVELGKYRGIDIERPVVKVDTKDLDEAIEELREHQSTFEPMKTGKAKDGDQVIIDFNGTVDGEEFSGGSAENYPYILGSQRFFPEFEEVLKGVAPGAEVSCEVTFPDDYFAEELQEKKADFTIKVNEVKRKKKPKVDDDFASEAGFDSLEAMKEEMNTRLRESSADRSKQIAEARAIEQVVESSTFEIAPSLIEKVALQNFEQQARELLQQGLQREDFEERMDEFREQSKESALRSIKTMVMLGEIGEAEGIEVTDEDFEAEAQNISKSIGADVESVAAYIQQDEQRSSYVDRIYRNKALAAIMDNANITDKELTRDEVEEEAAALEGDTGNDA